MCSVGVERCCHTGTNMSGNACLLPIIAKQRDCTDLLGCSSETNNSMRIMSSTLLVFIQYTLSGNNNFHKTILKKQKCETVLAENVCKPLKAEEEEIFQGRRDVENATNYKKDLFFSSSHPDTQTTVSLTTLTKKEKKKPKTKHTFIALFIITWGCIAFIKYLPGEQ